MPYKYVRMHISKQLGSEVPHRIRLSTADIGMPKKRLVINGTINGDLVNEAFEGFSVITSDTEQFFAGVGPDLHPSVQVFDVAGFRAWLSAQRQRIGLGT